MTGRQRYSLCDTVKYPGCGFLQRGGLLDAKGVHGHREHRHWASGSSLRDGRRGRERRRLLFYPHIPPRRRVQGGSRLLFSRAKASCEGALERSLASHLSLRRSIPRRGARGDLNVANFALDGIHPSQAGKTHCPRGLEVCQNRAWDSLRREHAACRNRRPSLSACTRSTRRRGLGSLVA